MRKRRRRPISVIPSYMLTNEQTLLFPLLLVIVLVVSCVLCWECGKGDIVVHNEAILMTLALARGP